MKLASFLGLGALLFGALVSCESTNSRRAGGGAFGESELARQLDANAPVPDPQSPGASSFEQWREQR